MNMPVSALTPSTHDLFDREVVKDALFALDRAETQGPEALAAWAREWGKRALEVAAHAREIGVVDCPRCTFIFHP